MSGHIVEFDLEGHVLAINRNFLEILVYQPQDVLGEHHSMFCKPD